MYVLERANADRDRRRNERAAVAFDTEIKFRPPIGPAQIVAIASYAEAQRIVAALNGRYTLGTSDDAA